MKRLLSIFSLVAVLAFVFVPVVHAETDDLASQIALARAQIAALEIQITALQTKLGTLPPTGPKPVITSMSPRQGKVGARVTLSVRELTQEGNAVLIVSPMGVYRLTDLNVRMTRGTTSGTVSFAFPATLEFASNLCPPPSAGVRITNCRMIATTTPAYYALSVENGNRQQSDLLNFRVIK